MGKYIRKSKGLGEVAVMEVAQVGVRTRAQAMAMAASNSGPAKRLKVGSEELRFPTSFFQLGSRRQVVVTPENSVSPADSSDPCASLSSGHALASCCSSNGSTEVAKETCKFTDLEEVESVEIETSPYRRERERRETAPSSGIQAESGELESTAERSEASSCRIPTVEKMPPGAELEKFFATAEKDLHRRFKEKYNYDVVKDVPLGGRYEWVQLKP